MNEYSNLKRNAIKLQISKYFAEKNIRYQIGKRFSELTVQMIEDNFMEKNIAFPPSFVREIFDNNNTNSLNSLMFDVFESNIYVIVLTN